MKHHQLCTFKVFGFPDDKLIENKCDAGTVDKDIFFEGVWPYLAWILPDSVATVTQCSEMGSICHRNTSRSNVDKM